MTVNLSDRAAYKHIFLSLIQGYNHIRNADILISPLEQRALPLRHTLTIH